MATSYFPISSSIQKVSMLSGSPVCCFNYEKGEHLLPLLTLNTELNKEDVMVLFKGTLSNHSV